MRFAEDLSIKTYDLPAGISLAPGGVWRLTDECLARLNESYYGGNLDWGNDDGWVALETILREKEVRVLVPLLKRAGASGIIEYPLNKVIY